MAIRSSQIKAKTLDELIVHVCRLQDKYTGMRCRVNSPTRSAYKERGIGMSDEWKGPKGRLAFAKWALINGFDMCLELDRIDNDKGYGQDNCRWVTHKENMRNTRTSKTLLFRGKKINAKTLSETKHCKVNNDAFMARLFSGWPLEEALSRPLNHGNGWLRKRRHR